MRAVLIAVLLVVATVAVLVVCKQPPVSHISPYAAPEAFAAGSTTGFEIDRQADPELVAALDGMMGTVQWLACVPAHQLIALLKAQADTGLTVIKADTVLESLRARKTKAQASIQRMGVSPAFKSQLIQFTEYTLSSFSDIVKTLQNADGFIDIKETIAKLQALATGYCTAPVGGANFGQGNNFVKA